MVNVETQPQPSKFCHNFTVNLRIGDSGEEVAALVVALNSEGLLSGKTDTFDEEVAAAVVEYQTQNNISPRSGFVGPLTRAKLNAKYSCRPTTQPSITVLSPNGGETYKAGERIPISFSTTLTDKQTTGITFQLYSTSGYVQDIVRGWIGGSPYYWTIPLNLNGSYRIYAAAEGLRDVNVKEVYDFSDSYFTITSGAITPEIQPMIISDINSIKSVVPSSTANLGFGVNQVSAQYNLGSYHQGRWYEGLNPGVSGPVWIEFGWPNSPEVDVVFYDQGNNEQRVYLPAVGSNNSTYGWYFWIAMDGSSYYAHSSHGPGWPDLTNKQALTSTHLARKAGAPIQPLSITSIYPTSNLTGSSATIYGTGFKQGAIVTIAFGSTEATYVSLDGTKILFTVPPNTAPGTYKVTVRNNDGTAESNPVLFTVTTTTTQPSITVLSPNGGETVTVGISQTMTWDSTENGPFDITLIGSGGGTYIIANAVNPTKTYQEQKWAYRTLWTAYAPYMDENPVLIKICKTRTNICDTSNSRFTIVSPTTQPSITVLSPNGGEEFIRGQAYTLKWTSSNITGPVTLSVLSSDGTVGGPIATNIANTGSYNWTVPLNHLEGAHRFYVSSGQTSDQSDSIFEIWATSRRSLSITVLAPNGGETLQAGLRSQIRWSAPISGVAGVDLVLQDATTGLTRPIAGELPNTGWYDWNILPELSGSYYVVAYAYGANRSLLGKDASDSYFKITSGFTTKASVSATLTDASTDKVGSWSNFGPGPGNANKNPNDWHWQMTLAISSGVTKTIKSIDLTHSLNNYSYEAWSSSAASWNGKLRYPLVVYYGSTQLNTNYDQSLGTYAQGSYTLDLYGQVETNQFAGGKLVVYFTDGSSTDVPVSASSITQTGSAQPTITSISPNPALIGNNITVTGTGFTGHDSILYITNGSDKALLWGGMPTSDTNISFNLAAQLCRQYTGGSGLPCSSYMTLVSGTYQVYILSSSGQSTPVNFTVSGTTQPPTATTTPPTATTTAAYDEFSALASLIQAFQALLQSLK